MILALQTESNKTDFDDPLRDCVVITSSHNVTQLRLWEFFQIWSASVILKVDMAVHHTVQQIAGYMK